MKYFVVRVEEEKLMMQYLIVFQSVTYSDGEFGSERQKKLKNKENLIHIDDFTFRKIKIFLMKNSLSKEKKKKGRGRF